MKNTAAKPFPVMPRLALLALLSPLWVLVFYVLPFQLDTTFKLGTDALHVTFYFVVPAIMVAAVFVTGCWRLAVIVVFSGFVLLSMLADHPDRYDGMIEFPAGNLFPEGTEIFCNGVKLGVTPCKIRISDLLEKLPRWTPPRQSLYFHGDRPLYTWIPWDAFRNDRYRGRKEALLCGEAVAFDMTCEFWWSFRYKGSTAFGGLADNWYQQDVSDIYRYRHPGNYLSIVYPASYAEFDLLQKILEDDAMQPTPQWINWLAENGRLYDSRMSRYDLSIVRRIAKKRYGLSDVPTPMECDRSIEQLLRENQQGWLISGEYNHIDGFDWEFSRVFGSDYEFNDAIAYRAVLEMGDACREPLLRRCRFLYRMDDFKSYPESDVYLSMLKEYPFPEFFDDMVRFYAVQQRGLSTLAAFDDPRLPALFDTIIRKRIPFDNLRDGYRSAYLTKICRPCLEPVIRKFLAEDLPRLDPKNAEELLSSFARHRYRLDWIDKEEALRWVRSLDLGGAEKTNAVAMFKQKLDPNPDRVWFYPESKVPEGAFGTEEEQRRYFSRSEVERLVEQQPERSVTEILRTVLGPKTSDSDIGRAGGALMLDALQQDREILVRKYWQYHDKRDIILRFIQGNYSDDLRLDDLNKYNEKQGYEMREEQFLLGGIAFIANRHEHGFYISSADEYRYKRPPAFYAELFAELDDPDQCVYLPSAIRKLETPSAMALVEKWSRSKNKQLSRNAESALAEMKYRVKLRGQARSLYDKLLTDRITPDDLLFDRHAWVWDGGKYVPE